MSQRCLSGTQNHHWNGMTRQNDKPKTAFHTAKDGQSEQRERPFQCKNTVFFMSKHHAPRPPPPPPHPTPRPPTPQHSRRTLRPVTVLLHKTTTFHGGIRKSQCHVLQHYADNLRINGEAFSNSILFFIMAHLAWTAKVQQHAKDTA